VNLFLIHFNHGFFGDPKRVCFLFSAALIGLLSACATAPDKASPIKTDAATPIVNQIETGLTEVQLNQSLESLLAQVNQTEGVPLATLELAFADTKNLGQVRKLVMPGPPGFKKNWVAYRGRFIEPVRVRAGKAFIDQNRSYLDQVERETGVPGTIIAAIIGVETIYGRHMGSFKVKDVLTTLAFNYPDTPNRTNREALFRDQLKQLILLCWTEAGGILPETRATPTVKTGQLNRCLNQTSSYAGAIGLPQFMPGSIRHFAKDGDGDGMIDLRQSRQDAIASVARFLQLHGWQPGMPIYLPIAQTESNRAVVERLADGIPTANLSVQQLIDLGVLENRYGDLQAGGVAPQSKALIVDLPFTNELGGDQVRYVVGLENFLSIVQYNRSYFYAQSVAEFAETLGYENKSVVSEPASVAKQKTGSNKAGNKKPTSKNQQRQRKANVN